MCEQYGIKKKVPIEPSQDPALEGRLGRRKKTPEELAAEAQLAEQEAERSSKYYGYMKFHSIMITARWRELCCRKMSVSLSIRPSVHLSGSGMVSKRLNMSSKFFHRMLASSF